MDWRTLSIRVLSFFWETVNVENNVPENGLKSMVAGRVNCTWPIHHLLAPECSVQSHFLPIWKKTKFRNQLEWQNFSGLKIYSKQFSLKYFFICLGFEAQEEGQQLLQELEVAEDRPEPAATAAAATSCRASKSGLSRRCDSCSSCPGLIRRFFKW